MLKFYWQICNWLFLRFVIKPWFILIHEVFVTILLNFSSVFFFKLMRILFCHIRYINTYIPWIQPGFTNKLQCQTTDSYYKLCGIFGRFYFLFRRKSASSIYKSMSWNKRKWNEKSCSRTHHLRILYVWQLHTDIHTQIYIYI